MEAHGFAPFGKSAIDFEYSRCLHFDLSYTFVMDDYQDNYQLYLENAHEMLDVASLNLDNDFYGSVCNRAYYAIFYAASALLYAKGMSFGKHSAVLSAFRQQFIKNGEFDVSWSRVYERIMSHRHSSDYDIFTSIEKEQAVIDLEDARQFVQEVEQWLHEKKYM
ncbi:MAG: HEPN domain-containing protein [Chloroflexota bacterium]